MAKQIKLSYRFGATKAERDAWDALAEIAKDVSKVTTGEGEYTYQGKLKNGISWVGIYYGVDGKLVEVRVSDGAKECIYDGAAGTYTVS